SLAELCAESGETSRESRIRATSVGAGDPARPGNARQFQRPQRKLWRAVPAPEGASRPTCSRGLRAAAASLSRKRGRREATPYALTAIPPRPKHWPTAAGCETV